MSYLISGTPRQLNEVDQITSNQHVMNSIMTSIMIFGTPGEQVDVVWLWYVRYHDYRHSGTAT